MNYLQQKLLLQNTLDSNLDTDTKNETISEEDIQSFLDEMGEKFSIMPVSASNFSQWLTQKDLRQADEL